MTSSGPVRPLTALARVWSCSCWRRAARRTGARDFAALGLILVALGAVAAGVRTAGLRYQHTDSLPKGLYRVEPGGRLARGTTAMWCLPAAWGRWARARHYLARGRCPGAVEPIGKVVLAMAGDTVAFDARGLRLNGRVLPHTAPILRDGRGQPLWPAPFGRYVLPPGEVWLWSPYTERSFDSRYFGPLPASALIAIVRPMWIAWSDVSCGEEHSAIGAVLLAPLDHGAVVGAGWSGRSGRSRSS